MAGIGFGTKIRPASTLWAAAYATVITAARSHTGERSRCSSHSESIHKQGLDLLYTDMYVMSEQELSS